IHEVLFPDGLRFTQLPYKLQWAASDVRLTQLKRDELDLVIRELGGGPLLQALYRAHAAYGEALGITETSVREPTTSIRRAYEEVLDAMRAYVVTVVSTSRKGDPASQDQAERLLKPLSDWPTRRGRSMQAGEPLAMPSELTTTSAREPTG